jgi:hypothetical protein
MERIPTLFTTEDLDAALTQILSEPSWAYRFLNGVADVLEGHAFLTVNEGLLTEALNLAKAYILGALPAIVVSQATHAAMDEMPEAYPGETADSLAARIRAAAEDLR